MRRGPSIRDQRVEVLLTHRQRLRGRVVQRALVVLGERLALGEVADVDAVESVEAGLGDGVGHGGAACASLRRRHA